MNILWKQLLNHKKIVFGAICVIALVFIGAAVKKTHSSDRISTGLFTSVPKKVSYAKQAKDGRTHVWMVANGDAKDSSVFYVIKLANGKETTYRILDDDSTLGKLSKMSDSQLLSFAEKQDKKFFEAGSKIISSGSQVGYNANYSSLEDTDTEGTNTLNFSFIGEITDSDNPSVAFAIPKNNDIGNDNPTYGDNTSYILFDTTGKQLSSNEGNNYRTAASYYLTDLYDGNNNNDSDSKGHVYLAQKLKSALLKQFNETKYVAPKAAKVKITTNTDDSGKYITSQTATINYINNYDSDKYATLLSVFQSNPSFKATYINAFNKLVKATKKFGSDSSSNDPFITNGIVVPIAANKVSINLFNELTTPSIMEQFVKNTIGSFNQHYNMNLEYTTDFDIYNSTFVGYQYQDNNDTMYFVTKAQSSKQTAEFAK